MSGRIRKYVLDELIRNSEVVEITSDDVPYIHPIDKTDDDSKIMNESVVNNE
jgi:hypothetical protein